jgi:flavin-dependent dehydrogenase
MIGDARGFIDPIFSSGVFLSMKSAYLVADAVHHQFSNKLDGTNAPMVKAYDQITGAYNFVHRMIKLFYNPHALTWAEVGTDGEVHRRHESAMAAGHYMLSGDFFENHDRYNQFFEMLEEPKKFERYKKIVMDQTKLQTSSGCNSKWEEVFGDLLHSTATAD